jgi:hypothetical protein
MRAFLTALLALPAAFGGPLSFTLPGGPATGRFRIYFSTPSSDPDQAPMRENADEQSTNQVFAFDAAVLSPDDVFTLNATHMGYPLGSISDLPPKTTFLVQAEFVPYEKVERVGLPPTYLPTSCVSASGMNGAYEKPDGTSYSETILWTAEDPALTINLVNVIPPSKPLSPGCAGLGDGVDSKYIKTLRIRSELLTSFYEGTEKTLEACVLLPEG